MNIRLIYYTVIISLTLIGNFLSYTSTYADIIFKSDNETGDFSQWPKRGLGPKALCCSHSGQVVTSPVRSGKYAARFEVRYTDPNVFNSKRAEMINYGDSRIGNIGGPDEWYGFSLYLPADYEIDPLGEIVVQWHPHSDNNSEGGRGPTLAFETVGGNWQISTKYSSKPISTKYDTTWVFLWKSPYERGIWVDWVIHAKWSYQSDGFIEIWKDGKRIVDYKGPNTYNDKRNMWFQWGVYKWPWRTQPTNTTKRVIYNDELRIGDSNSSYAEVAPPSRDGIAPSSPVLNLASQ